MATQAVAATTPKEKVTQSLDVFYGRVGDLVEIYAFSGDVAVHLTKSQHEAIFGPLEQLLRAVGETLTLINKWTHSQFESQIQSLLLSLEPEYVRVVSGVGRVRKLVGELSARSDASAAFFEAQLGLHPGRMPLPELLEALAKQPHRLAALLGNRPALQEMAARIEASVNGAPDPALQEEVMDEVITTLRTANDWMSQLHHVADLHDQRTVQRPGMTRTPSKRDLRAAERRASEEELALGVQMARMGKKISKSELAAVEDNQLQLAMEMSLAESTGDPELDQVMRLSREENARAEQVAREEEEAVMLALKLSMEENEGKGKRQAHRSTSASRHPLAQPASHEDAFDHPFGASQSTWDTAATDGSSSGFDEFGGSGGSWATRVSPPHAGDADRDIWGAQAPPKKSRGIK